MLLDTIDQLTATIRQMDREVERVCRERTPETRPLPGCGRGPDSDALLRAHDRGLGLPRLCGDPHSRGEVHSTWRYARLADAALIDVLPGASRQPRNEDLSRGCPEEPAAAAFSIVRQPR